MKRNLEPVDLVVAVGVFATMLGGYLFFMAPFGPIEAATSETISIGRSPDIMQAMQWVQPALGQAIVNDYLLGRAASTETTNAVMELNQATMAAYRLQGTPFGHLDRVAAHATWAEADHAGRVQFVLGRMIVNFSARGIRNGTLSPGHLSGRYNSRMIAIAQATGNKMDEEFENNRQARLGEAIVAASQWHARHAGQIQERVGNAVLRVARVRDGYREASEAIQAQLASVASAGIRTELKADLLARLAAAEPATLEPPLSFVEPRSWSHIPAGVFFAASIVLASLFLVGLTIPSGRGEPASEVHKIAEAVDRKAA